MHQLAGADAAFLYAERPEWHFHVSGVLIVDPTDAPGFGVDLIRRRLADRLHLMPQFRWKLVSAPWGVDRPIFVDDPHFDLEAHLRHVAVPAPGDERTLGRLLGRLISYKLDRTHPLWEMWVIEGLAGGRVAVLTKIHHSIVDGVSGSDLATIILDHEPDPGPDPEPPPYEPAPGPSVVQRALHTAIGAAQLPWRQARLAEQTARQSITYLRHTRRDAPPAGAFQAPRTPFNGSLSPHREFACARIPLVDAKQVKDTFGVKLNDVVLAVCAGALRDYLIGHDALPDKPLIAQIPVSIRTDETRGQVGTQVAAMFASLGTDIGDPVERLQVIHDSTQSAKEMRQALTADRIMGLTDTTPPGLISIAARLFTSMGIEGRIPPVFNLIVSNVPGPPFDLYLAGARVEALYPLGPLLYGSGVNITCISTAHSIDFGFESCPELMPDVWTLASGIEPAMTELLRSARRASRSAPKARSPGPARAKARTKRGPVAG